MRSHSLSRLTFIPHPHSRSFDCRRHSCKDHHRTPPLRIVRRHLHAVSSRQSTDKGRGQKERAQRETTPHLHGQGGPRAGTLYAGRQHRQHEPSPHARHSEPNRRCTTCVALPPMSDSESRAQGVGSQRSAALLAAFGAKQQTSVDALDAVRHAHFTVEGEGRGDGAGRPQGGWTGLRSYASHERFVPVVPSRLAEPAMAGSGAEPLSNQHPGHYFCASCAGASLCQRCLGYDLDRAKQARPASVLRQRQRELNPHASKREAAADDAVAVINSYAQFAPWAGSSRVIPAKPAKRKGAAARPLPSAEEPHIARPTG